MDSRRYSLLLRSLDFPRAIELLEHDAKDDYFPDPIRYADIVKFRDGYLERTKHRRLDHFAYSAPTFQTPKPGCFLRDIVHLPPPHRVIYLAILDKLLPKIDPKLPEQVYSYRLDTSDARSGYPFISRLDRWKDFYNDFRRAAIEPSAQAVLIGDIASFYDHISVDRLIEVIKSVLGGSSSDEDEACLELLRELLLSWTQDGYGMPVNYDPSSFFSSVYLTPVDRAMIDGRFQYFRWADDIRLVATSKAQAIRGLHHLQGSLRKMGLYLSTAKTHIFEKGTDDFDREVDVADDVRIATLEAGLRSGSREELAQCVEMAAERLAYHAGPEGDDRKFRAFATRLERASTYDDLREAIWPTLKELVLQRHDSHPNRSDYWTRLLSQSVDDDVQDAAHDILTTPGRNIFDWQRMYLWELLIRGEKPIQPRLIEQARGVAKSLNCDPVAARAAILVGKHSDDVVREQLFGDLHLRHRSIVIKRAVLIAIQEMATPGRDRLYDAALRTDPEQTELIEYLQTRPTPRYTVYHRQTRTFPAEPVPTTEVIKRGIGTVEGEVVHFMLSGIDYDYE